MSEAHDDLVRARVVVPVELGGDEERAWLDCDLASLAENRLGDRADPRTLDEARRAAWQERATLDRPYPLRHRAELEQPGWLLEGGERVGTLSVGEWLRGARSVRLSSFYVFPTHRGRGVGQRALRRVSEVLARHGLGYRLDTSWSWQRTVRFYMQAGLWVRMWKRDLDLAWDPSTPAPRVAIEGDSASLSVPRGGEMVTLARARRRGEALDLEETWRTIEESERLSSVGWEAVSTLSLAIALEGWPLVRSPAHWEEHSAWDSGAPEALAQRITVWEAWDRHHGWRAPAPRMPGLEYPTWPELEARWEAERAAYFAQVGEATERAR